MTRTSEPATICRMPKGGTDKPPLLFVHGAMLGAWCWDEHWLPAAADRGWACHAVDLRGHGADARNGRRRHIRLSHYVQDIVDAAAKLDEPPFLVGHSMGARLVQDVAKSIAAPALVLIAPIPASGAWRAASRIARCNWRDVVNLATGIPWSPSTLRQYLYSDDLDGALIESYTQRAVPESLLTIYGLMLPRWRLPTTTPALVMGAAKDAIVPRSVVRGTAHRYGTEPLIFDRTAHNLMLDTRWQPPLVAMLEWLERQLVGNDTK